MLILSLRKLRGFLLYGFPEENYLCLLSLMFIDVHVILSDNILRSYCLNDKNLKTSTSYLKDRIKEENNTDEFFQHVKAGLQ